MAFLDLRRESRQVRPARLPARHAGDLGSERKVRMPTAGKLRERSGQAVVVRETRRRQCCKTSCLIRRKRASEERHCPLVSGFGERTHGARIELAIERTAPAEHERSLAGQATRAG